MTNEVAVSVVAILFLSALYAGIIALTVISYIFTAKAMYKLSVRRNIANPWMAWVPGLNSWNLGLVANEYDGRLGMKRSWNKILVILHGAVIASISLVYPVMFIMMLLVNIQGAVVAPAMAIVLGIIMYIFMIIMIVIMITRDFIAYIVIFKIFESTVPDKAVKYLILSLVVPVASAVCLMKCADKGYPFPENEPEIITE